jgi:hypothetical protein
MQSKLLVCAADIQFSSLQDWSLPLGEKILQWLDQVKFPGKREDREFILGGDVVERDTNPGDVIDLMYALFKTLNREFSHVWVLVGNHDLRYYKKKLQFAFKFLNRWEGFTIVEREEIFTTPNGFNVIALPFQKFGDKSVDDYYTNELPQAFYKTEADVLVAHTARSNLPGQPKTHFGGVDFSRFAARDFALSHIHSRRGPWADNYCGSWAPLKIDEDDHPGDLPRCFKVYEKKSGVVRRSTDILIPKFVEYNSVQYPDPILTPDDDLIHIYLVKGCNNLQRARDKYPSSYIRAVERSAASAERGAVAGSGSLFKSNVDAFKDMVRETGIRLNRKTYNYLIEILS